MTGPRMPPQRAIARLTAPGLLPERSIAERRQGRNVRRRRRGRLGVDQHLGNNDRIPMLVGARSGRLGAPIQAGRHLAGGLVRAVGLLGIVVGQRALNRRRRGRWRRTSTYAIPHRGLAILISRRATVPPGKNAVRRGTILLIFVQQPDAEHHQHDDENGRDHVFALAVVVILHRRATSPGTCWCLGSGRSRADIG